MITALIPARGGSKRVPMKNVRAVGGRALIDWSIDLAIQSKLIEKTIVSTDSVEIVTKSNNLEPYLEHFKSSPVGSLIEIVPGLIIHKRSPISSSDHSKTYSIVEEIFQISDVISEDLLLLQPTSPFRTSDEIVDLIKLKSETNADSIFSVSKAESPHPYKCFQVDENLRVSLNEQIRVNLQTPEQELPNFYAPDGAFYLASKEFLKKEKAFINGSSTVFMRSGPRTINIDTELDLKFAQYVADL